MLPTGGVQINEDAKRADVDNASHYDPLMAQQNVPTSPTSLSEVELVKQSEKEAEQSGTNKGAEKEDEPSGANKGAEDELNPDESRPDNENENDGEDSSEEDDDENPGNPAEEFMASCCFPTCTLLVLLLNGICWFLAD